MSAGAAAAGAQTLHASAVAVDGRGLLILGEDGAGKTTLSLEMIVLGARLVADDRVAVAPDGAGGLRLDAPEGLAGLAELRGFGLIRLPPAGPTQLVLIADLDRSETERLPNLRDRAATLPGDLPATAAPVMLCKGRAGLAAVLTCILRATDWPDPETFSLHPVEQ